jgi:hypothetical protein
VPFVLIVKVPHETPDCVMGVYISANPLSLATVPSAFPATFLNNCVFVLPLAFLFCWIAELGFMTFRSGASLSGPTGISTNTDTCTFACLAMQYLGGTSILFEKYKLSYHQHNERRRTGLGSGGGGRG